MLLDDRVLAERAAQIETLLDEIEAFPDPALRSKAAAIVQDLLVLYGEGLARILAIMDGVADEEIRSWLLEACVRDDLITHLLLLHDLHPLDVETRVRQALDEVRPYLQSHGGDVELVGIADGVARLRLQGSCHGCPSSTMTLKLAIEEAISKAAPDLDGIEAEGVEAPPPRPSGFIPISDLLPPGSVGAPAAGQPAAQVPWTTVDGLPPLLDGSLTVVDVTGASLLFVRLDGAYYAYSARCPGCELQGASHENDTAGSTALARARLTGAELSCPGCGHVFDVRRAGRCLDSPELHLDPVPLLARDGEIRVAVGHV